MQKMKCVVCGYIHEGESAPEKCPVCGVSAEKFELVSEDKTWKCKICSYLHKGDFAPEKCPICFAIKEKFVAVDAKEKTPVEEKAEDKAEEVVVKKESLLTNLIQKHHLHPISVHFPNGILPAIALFIVLAFILGDKSLDSAAFYCSIFVLINMPLVLFSGYVEWQRRYNGAKTTVFIIKIACSVVVLLTLLAVVLWRFISPDLLFSGGSSYVYIGLSLLMLTAAGIAGHLGGGLIAASRE